MDVNFGYYLWPMCVDTANVGVAGAGRRVPASPAIFEELLQTRKFTNQADSAQVTRLYEKVRFGVSGRL